MTTAGTVSTHAPRCPTTWVAVGVWLRRVSRRLLRNLLDRRWVVSTPARRWRSSLLDHLRVGPGLWKRRVPSAGVRRTVEDMSHRASDDEIRDQEREEREEVVDVDDATAMAALVKVMKRDAELLKRLAR